jgi:hypothetical protein
MHPASCDATDSGSVWKSYGSVNVCHRHAENSEPTGLGRARSPARRGRRRASAIALLIGGLALLVSLATNVADAQETVSIFGNAVPANAVAADDRAVTLGVKFSSSRAGQISAIRFFRGARSPLGYIANLYTDSGKLLASVRVPTETSPIPGWQTAMLPTPVPIAANTIYVAAYYTPNGRYADDRADLATGLVRGDLQIPGNSAVGGNGVIHYGLGFPREERQASNYYVDVLFTLARPSRLTAASPGPAAMPRPPPGPPPGPPVLSLSFIPPNPSVPKTARPGTVVARIIAHWSDGDPFRGTLAFGPPYWNDGGVFAITGDRLIVNPKGPGVTAAAGAIHVTVVATQ